MSSAKPHFSSRHPTATFLFCAFRAGVSSPQGRDIVTAGRPSTGTISVCFCAALALSLGFSGAGLAAEPGAGKRPNILIAIADDWSHGHAGAYGCQWIKTPAFDRVAREGVLFANAFTNNPKCSPCRASLLTGRNSWQLDEACNHFGVFPASWPVYPDLLEQAGYLVGFTGKGWGPGDFRAGGFKRNPAGPEYNRHATQPPVRGVSDVDYARNFADFLADRKPDQPFCFWFGGTEPHRDYEDGAGRRSRARTRRPSRFRRITRIRR